MNYTPFNTEQILLAHMLVYGEETSKYILPNLLPTRFVYSKEGELGGSKDHATIFKAMTLVALEDKVMPTVSSVLNKLVAHGTNYKDYLGALRVMLSGYYQIYEFDARYVMQLAEQVDKAGTMFYAASRSHKVSSILESAETFAKAVDSVEDVDEWINRHVVDLTSLTTSDVEGYKHIGLIREELQPEIQRIFEGEQLFLLDNGIPSLMNNGLFPTGNLVVLQGRSNSGKSAFVNQLAMGTAIGLKTRGIQGCCAINSFEENQMSLLLKCAGQLAGLNIWDFKMGKNFSAQEYNRLQRALDYVATLPIYVDTSNLLTMSTMEYRMSGLHASEHGPVKFLSVDYLERIKRESMDREKKDELLEKLIYKGLDIARNLDVLVIILSQSVYSNGSDKMKIAGAEGTRGSRSIQFASDYLVEIYNPPQMIKAGVNFDVPENLNKEQPFLLIEKVREGPIPDPIGFGWIPEARQFFCMELNQQMGLYPKIFDFDIPDFYGDTYEIP